MPRQPFQKDSQSISSNRRLKAQLEWLEDLLASSPLSLEEKKFIKGLIEITKVSCDARFDDELSLHDSDLTSSSNSSDCKPNPQPQTKYGFTPKICFTNPRAVSNNTRPDELSPSHKSSGSDSSSDSDSDFKPISYKYNSQNNNDSARKISFRNPRTPRVSTSKIDPVKVIVSNNNSTLFLGVQNATNHVVHLVAQINKRAREHAEKQNQFSSSSMQRRIP